MVCPAEWALADEAPDLPVGELAKRGRAATAYLEVAPGRTATAFCVHPSGLFITNHHVVHGATTPIKLVLNSGTLEQKVFAAKVVRRDRASDLALLSVDGATNLPTLPLGVADSVVELMDVIALGFPFGRVLTPGVEQYPSVSMNRGAVSSLKRKGDELERIQMNAAVNPGNSGGPLLDGKGRVVGVIVGRVEGPVGAGIDLAIPVNLVDRFLSRPTIEFKPPASDAIERAQSVEFTAQVTSLVPKSAPLDMELVFAAGTPVERKFRMDFADGAYRAQAVPFPVSNTPVKLAVEVQFPDGFVRGVAEDRTIAASKRELKLSELRTIQLSPKRAAQLPDGMTLDAEFSPPSELELSVGGQTLHLNLSKALTVNMPDAEVSGAVSCSLVVLKGREEVARESVPIYLKGAARPSIGALRDARFVKPARSTTPITYLRFESLEGDFIGQGKTYAYDKDELTLRRFGAGVQCQVGEFGSWSLGFSAGQNKSLEAVEYRNAKRLPFSGESPGIELTGNGRGCNQISGEFRVWEIELRGNDVTRLAVDFVQRCEEKMPPLVGMFRYNSTFY
jgi:hypothetical protein